MVPDPGGASGSAKYLCENGAWSVPPVTVLQGRAVASTPPSDTQVLAWHDAAHQWQPTAAYLRPPQDEAQAEGAAVPTEAQQLIDLEREVAARRGPKS